MCRDTPNIEKETSLTFDSLGLDAPILKTLTEAGYTKPTPIQSKAIPVILAGRDVVGLAQTGTGKTAAFTLPLIQRLNRNQTHIRPGSVRVLIVSPTRELAAQIHASVRTYAKGLSIISACVVGGVSMRQQKNALKRGLDILVATPGRLLDLADQNCLRFDDVETLILDEADQMLDIGFLPAIKRIIAACPKTRQTLLFSATMPKEIKNLSREHLHNPEEVAVAPVSKTADKIEQGVMHLTSDNKIPAIIALIKKHRDKQVIVFTRTKRGADRVVRRLEGSNLTAAAIHGNKSQNQRERALDAFRAGKCPVLVATDIAARGIDVPGIGLVINFELPNVPEVYVHRIGRTARAERDGLAISFCDPEEQYYLRDIQRLIKLEVPVLPAPEGVEGLKTPNLEDARKPKIVQQQRPPRRERPAKNAGKPTGKPRSKPAGKRPEKAKRPANAKPAGDKPNNARPQRRRRPNKNRSAANAASR